MVSPLVLSGAVMTYRLKSSVTTSRYLYCVPSVVGLSGPTRPACNLSNGLDVLITLLCGCLLVGGLVAFPFSHRGFVPNLGHPGNVLRVS